MEKVLAVDPSDDIIRESIDENIPVIARKEAQAQTLRQKIDNLGAILFPNHYPKYSKKQMKKGLSDEKTEENSGVLPSDQKKDEDAEGFML